MPPTMRLSASICAGLVKSLGRTPKSKRLAEKLLEQDREVHHCFYNAGKFHNHLSHQYVTCGTYPSHSPFLI